MEMQIEIYEASEPVDVAAFWQQLYDYFKRDLFPDPEDGDRAYFLGEEYRHAIQKIHDRKENRGYYLFFRQEGQDIGFALPVLFSAEDGRCFLMEFCIYPQFRGRGAGKACAGSLWRWAREKGASYAELNCGNDAGRCRFWSRAGFVKNGADEWGNPLMILPPKEELPITVELLSDPEDWQLKKLENGFLCEIGEPPLTEEKQARLAQAIREGKIIFFVAMRGSRMVGMCSVARCFSTFSCADMGIWDDFYIEPVFRKKGVARKLAQRAQDWCREQGLASLTVCCAPCDEKRYHSLGFHTRLGTTFAFLPSFTHPGSGQ